ncbi:GTA head formation protein, RCAP_rcc01685 family [Pseudooceanicola aestuarii]|uniref:GTA head formation protein, RCAP_rcc01685 family n=1 Tax=Pseudooceanicola aestuarii TaxID=2697319 RepID=UPI0013D26D45|nr:hypothetical protein [Pseudooceanicola aestuarii]
MADPTPLKAFEPFTCAPGLRLEAHERLTDLQVAAMNARLARIEEMIARLDRRLWLAVYGIVGVILAQAFQSLIGQLP